jgi:hypothetical protein
MASPEYINQVYNRHFVYEQNSISRTYRLLFF